MADFGDKPLLEPLSFNSSATDGVMAETGSSMFSQKAVCLLCDVEFTLPGHFETLNLHLQDAHSLVISKMHEITDLPKYLEYWRKRIGEGLTLQDICKNSMSTTNSPSSQKESLLNVLSEELEEDKQLRSNICLNKLQERLDHQQKEREDDGFSRTCLFCTRHFHFNRSALFEHMADYHHFNIGHPDNLVYTNELLTMLERKLQNLQCLYCEKTFKDSFVLKEHMRKKRHRRLRLSNYVYRQFYIVYPETTKAVDSDDDDIDDDNAPVSGEDDSDDEPEMAHHGFDVDDYDTDGSSSVDHNDWNDWVGMAEPAAVCLFCTHTEAETGVLFAHMKDVHRFDLHELAASNKLVYYQQVKLINYIRRQVHCNTCTSCGEKFDDRDKLLRHLDASDHASQLPEKSKWNQPQYFFPTYENDSLLCALIDGDDDAALADAGEEVIAEDLPEGVRELNVGQYDKTRLDDDADEI